MLPCPALSGKEDVPECSVGERTVGVEVKMFDSVLLICIENVPFDGNVESGVVYTVVLACLGDVLG